MANKPTYEELEQRVEDLEKEDMKPKRMGEALRKSEEHYRILIETIPHGIQEIDTTGTLIFVNDAYCRLMGYEEREVSGKPIFDFIQFETPSGKEELREYLKLLVKDQPLRTSFFQRNRRKDGKVLDVQVDWNYKRNEQGLVTGFISVLTDITEHRKSQEELRKVHRDLEKRVGERTAELTEVNEQLNREIEGHKQTEVELRESEERFRSLVETTSDWIWEVDSSGVYTYCSPRAEELLGYKPEELIGRTPFDLMPPDEAESVTTVFREKVASQTPFERLENVNFHKDGTLLVLETSGVPIFDAKGDLLGYRGIDRDITERKRMEEELARTQKLESLGVLAGGIAHDFNNILTAISTNISMARMYGNLEDDISQMMADAEKASLRAKNLTQQLLAFAKGGRPIKTTVSIAQLLRDTAEFALSGSNVQSEYSIPEDLWFATVDEGQIGQVINNLVINADQAMPEGGTIDISAENVLVGEHDQIALEKGKYVRVSLKDQGIGIFQKHLNKIFDPFFTTKQKGSGLGLATSFTIVKNHGGHIGVHSEPDIGTTVDVYLPASEEAFETGAIEKKRPIKGEGRVLLIDDEEMIRRSTGEMLKRFGYDVKLAKDGEEGLKFYKKARESGLPFDAVMMDLTIRGGRGGKETVRELMKINPDAKVIVSSGYSDDPVMSEFGEYGFVGVVEKPYRIKDLGALLDKVIAEERR